MLFVTKLLEGGLDLMSGDRLPAYMVVSSATGEVAVPLPDEILESVAKLILEDAEQNDQEQQERQTPEHDGEVLFKAPEHKHPTAAPKVPAEFEVPDPPHTVIDDEDPDPGEDYSDSGTGVGSL